MTLINRVKLKTLYLECKKYSIFVFYFLYFLSILHILRLTVRGFVIELGSRNTSVLDFVIDFVRTYTFIIVFNAILIYNLLFKKQLAYYFSLFLIIGNFFLGYTRHFYIFWPISSVIQICILILHFNTFKVKAASYGFKQKLIVSSSLLVGMLLYYFVGFKLLASSFNGSISFLNILGNYLSNFVDPSSLDFYINDITPSNILAKIYLNSLEYVGWVISILITINLFSGVKVKIPYLTSDNNTKLNQSHNLIDEDSLTVFKKSNNLIQFTFQGNFIFYQQKENLRIVLGDPVLKYPENILCLKEFINQSHKEGQIVSFFQTTKKIAYKLREFGLSDFLLGHEAILPLDQFVISGPSQSDLRYSKNKLEREGVQLEFLKFTDLQPSQISIFESLKKVWTKEKGNSELGFSSGFHSFDPEIEGWLVLAKDQDFGYVGACTFLPFGKKSLVLDFMIQSPFAKPQFMDGLLTSSILKFKELGFEKLSLGLAPIDVLSRDNIISKVANNIQNLQKNTYKYTGLRKFKQKFNPIWEERYLVTEGIETLPLVLQFLTILFYKKNK